MELYDATELNEDFEYPAGIHKVVELDLDWWQILEAAFAGDYAHGMARCYPKRKLIPFAKRSDSDDVARFEVSRPGRSRSSTTSQTSAGSIARSTTTSGRGSKPL